VLPFLFRFLYKAQLVLEGCVDLLLCRLRGKKSLVVDSVADSGDEG